MLYALTLPPDGFCGFAFGEIPLSIITILPFLSKVIKCGLIKFPVSFIISEYFFFFKF